MKKLKIAVIGGDLRQAYLACELLKDGHTVYIFGFSRVTDLPCGFEILKSFDIIGECDMVILPLPMSLDAQTVNMPMDYHPLPLDVVYSNIKKGTLVLAGKVGPEDEEKAKSMDIKLIDYFEREELTILNAVPTAEGAIQLALEELPITLHGSNVLITGHGRIAKVLIKKLTALSAKVAVASRKYSDMAWTEIEGCEAIHISRLKEQVGRFDLLINTIPAVVLSEEILSKLKKDCLVIDLASKPGGVDFDIARNLNIKTIWALSLPGKVAPLSSGKIIKNTIRNILDERRNSFE